MYNSKAKISAITILVTVGLVVGLMIMFPFMMTNLDGDASGLGLVFVLMLFGPWGTGILYLSTLPFVIVGLIFGIKMLRGTSRKKLISYNVRMLIATCVLAPFVGLGVTYIGMLFSMSAINLFFGLYGFLVAAAYVICLIMQIVAIVLLKKTPEEPAAAPAAGEAPELKTE
ncbi:MAG: hypothetical protein J1F39_04585 [Clostridiales bacterium]|nr:hypothetical protein [Clostridiales bacterium]